MQIIIGIAIFIVIITVILFKVNDRFEKREFIILLIIIFLVTIGTILYEKSKDNYLPNIFKEKYEKDKDIRIESLNYELLNNKVVSSKDKFIYNFTYLITKDDKIFLCTMNNVEINKVQNLFVFKNFANLKEECIEK
ncbi:hypothetical protein [Aliarcobacter vitoriensis]|uniref:Uncharacterized protein n=1 Tax=Aliarcobacter vitoriensis TaxID=2011099 RepID=A0A366MVG3_9BACT|nr:hypothetical protein [Aliarcobacter vitoriensis]RBQ29600.1 hypothetical protein CRU91_03085 [Aliarcobacter vitoriensis]RBQ32175.1 hypothetical protein CRU92_00250 [Arcobacter sp. FW59]